VFDIDSKIRIIFYIYTRSLISMPRTTIHRNRFLSGRFLLMATRIGEQLKTIKKINDHGSGK